MENLYLNLPLYECVITDDCDGIEYVSLTAKPATQVKWMMFSNEMIFSKMDEDRRLVTSCLMLADTPIYRRDKNMGEYYIQYSKETLREMAERFLKNCTGKVNIEHLPDSCLNDIELQEIYIKDVERGIDPVEFKDCPDGSLFCTYKVNNDVVWSNIKAGNLKGFSLEGLFTLERYSEEMEMKQLLNMLRKIRRIK